MEKRWYEFDGLRILALLIIIASHTNALGMFGQGSVAVSLFFVMSGFFCVKPMLDNGEETFANIKGWLKFYILKIVRIVPLYWICILFVKYVSDNIFSDNKFLLQNMFFINSYGHLWYIQHLMVAYLVTPLILWIIFLLKKYCKFNNFMSSAVLFIIGVIGGKYLLISPYIWLYWNGTQRRLYIGLFIIGMATGYFIKAINQKQIKKKMFILIGDVMEILFFLTISIFTASSFLGKINPVLKDYHIGWSHPIFCGLISACLVFIIAINTNGYIAKLLRLPVIVKFGQASFGIYIVHYFFLEFIALPPVKLFLLITIISFCIGLVSYEMAEKPLYYKVRQMMNKNK